MNACFADTSYFVALFNAADSLHAKARELEPFIDIVVTTEFVLIEVANFFLRPGDREIFAFIDASLRAQEHNIILEANRGYYSLGLELFCGRPDRGWSLTDCISFEVMTELGLTEALTADHHFEQAGFVVLLKP